MRWSAQIHSPNIVISNLEMNGTDALISVCHGRFLNLAMAVMITGGTGQIGAFLCKSLLRSNQDIVIFDVKPNLENIRDFSDRVRLVDGDVTNLSSILETIKKYNVTTIYHLAAVVVLESRENPLKSASVNCVGTVNIFEAGRIANLDRIVFVSSSAVYGRMENYSSNVVSEDDVPRCPADPYSATKVMNEVFGQHYYSKFGVKTLCLRVAAAWGPGRYTGFTGAFNDMIRKLAHGEAATLPPDFAYPKAPLRWLYVEDLGDIFAHAGRVDEGKIQRRLYNVGTRTPFTPVEFVAALNDALPAADIRVEWRDTPTELALNVAGPSGMDIDCSRFYQDLGYHENTSLRASIERAIAFERGR
jgi:UDP-glucose 4-epimerase